MWRCGRPLGLSAPPRPVRSRCRSIAPTAVAGARLEKIQVLKQAVELGAQPIPCSSWSAMLGVTFSQMRCQSSYSGHAARFVSCTSWRIRDRRSFDERSTSGLRISISSEYTSEQIQSLASAVAEVWDEMSRTEKPHAPTETEQR